MKHYPPPLPPARSKPTLRIPRFHAVPLRQRADGWTPLRQAEFIGHLAETRSVAEAARRVSMARETAYRLRDRAGAEGFAAAWDVALALVGHAAGRARYVAALEAARGALIPHAKVTAAELEWRIETGIWQVLMRGGRYRGVRSRPDNSALLALLARSDRAEQVDAR